MLYGRPRMPAVTFFGLSHVDLPVSDLDKARVLYVDALGFAGRDQGEGWVDLDTGSCSIRLLATRKPEHPVAIRVQSPTVEAALEHLCELGARLHHPATRMPDQSLVGAVRDRDGNTVYVWRALSEDEYDFVPELPKVLTWQPDAEALLKSLLKAVPALFRGLARRRVAAVAEELAAATRFVTREEVIRGYILASPKVTRGRNRKPLVDHGIDVDRYQADWDAD
jgi:catechol 2,3-dioxygenase-like lactoylglutathione lyase family enzyme